VAPYQSQPAPAASLSDATPTTPKHIALLVICIDELPYEHIWKAWAAAATTGDTLVSILVHAKYPSKVQSSWLRQRLLVRPPRIGRGNCYADPVYLSHAPEWGSVQITSAMVELVAAGLKIGPNDRETDERFSSRRFLVETTKDDSNSNKTDQQKEGKVIPPVDKFIFVSETCLPVKTLKECEEALFKEVKVAAETKGNEDTEGAIETSGKEDMKTLGETDGKEDVKAPAESKADAAKVSSLTPTARSNEVSWINARNRNTPGTPQNKYERDQFQDINRMVPQACRWKADQWTVLSRAHAAAVLNIDQHMRPDDQLWNSFARINASDEMYFPTALAVLGILKDEDDSTVPQVAKRAVTYTDWTEGMRNPATYTNGIRDFKRVAKIARKQGCLFARKFALVHAIPGKEKVVTGAIDVEAWKEAIGVLQKAEESS
jgi:hypothetical protein